MKKLHSLSSARPLPPHLGAIIENGAWEGVVQALNDGLSPNLIYDGDQTLFGAIIYVLAEGGVDSTTSSAHGPSLLVRAFIDRGLNLRYPHCDLTPIVEVVAGGQWDWLDALLVAGYPVESEEGQSAFHALVDGRMVRRLRGLEDEEWEDGSVDTHDMVFNEDLPEERLAVLQSAVKLSAAGADMSALRSEHEEHPPITALQLAIMYGDRVAVEALLLAGFPVAMEVSGSAGGFLPLHPILLAAKEGESQILDMLLGHAGLDVMGHHGVDAMHVAASKGHLDCMKVLHVHGIPYDAPTREGMFYPLHQAALHGHKEIIDFLLDHDGKWERESQTGVTAGSILRTHQSDLARDYGIAVPESNILPFHRAARA